MLADRVLQVQVRVHDMCCMRAAAWEWRALLLCCAGNMHAKRPRDSSCMQTGVFKPQCAKVEGRCSVS